MRDHSRRRVAAATGLALCLICTPSEAEPKGKHDPFDWSLRDGIVYEDPARELRVDLEGRFALDWMQWDDRNARSSNLGHPGAPVT